MFSGRAVPTDHQRPELSKLGIHQRHNTLDWSTKTGLLWSISLAFPKGAGITKNISLKTLRKTYITWVNHAMGNKTGLLTSHSTEEVIDRHYIDPKILSAIEMGVMNIKVFGEIPHAKRK